MTKIKLKIVSNHKVDYFLEWERPFFEEHFEIVDEYGPEVFVFAYGPDAFFEAVNYPAKKRFAILFPGFDFNPYHNLSVRQKTLQIIEDQYDGIFVNPGPIKTALEMSGKVFEHPFSVNVSKLRKLLRVRNNINSLLHLSADSPQKDWQRSQEVMRCTGLRYEVFPPRNSVGSEVTIVDRIKWRFNKYIVGKVAPTRAFRYTLGYQDHNTVIRKYLEFDAFVHIAAEKPLPLHLDGKYTAALLEAAVTGSIIFWHDTFGAGNDFETIFSLSGDPVTAASQILEIRDSIDVEALSKRTSDEVSERCDPRKVVAFRARVINELV